MSNLYKDHLKSLFKINFLGPIPKDSDSIVFGGAQVLHF